MDTENLNPFLNIAGVMAALPATAPKKSTAPSALTPASTTGTTVAPAGTIAGTPDNMRAKKAAASPGAKPAKASPATKPIKTNVTTAAVTQTKAPQITKTPARSNHAKSVPVKTDAPKSNVKTVRPHTPGIIPRKIHCLRHLH